MSLHKLIFLDYKDILSRKLQDLGPLVPGTDTLQRDIDDYINTITETMQESAKLAGCSPKKQYTPKK